MNFSFNTSNGLELVLHFSCYLPFKVYICLNPLPSSHFITVGTFSLCCIIHLFIKKMSPTSVSKLFNLLYLSGGSSGTLVALIYVHLFLLFLVLFLHFDWVFYLSCFYHCCFSSFVNCLCYNMCHVLFGCYFKFPFYLFSSNMLVLRQPLLSLPFVRLCFMYLQVCFLWAYFCIIKSAMKDDNTAGSFLLYHLLSVCSVVMNLIKYVQS